MATNFMEFKGTVSFAYIFTLCSVCGIKRCELCFINLPNIVLKFFVIFIHYNWILNKNTLFSWALLAASSSFFLVWESDGLWATLFPRFFLWRFPQRCGSSSGGGVGGSKWDKSCGKNMISTIYIDWSRERNSEVIIQNEITWSQ